jgi:hypothetical protein
MHSDWQAAWTRPLHDRSGYEQASVPGFKECILRNAQSGCHARQKYICHHRRDAAALTCSCLQPMSKMLVADLWRRWRKRQGRDRLRLRQGPCDLEGCNPAGPHSNKTAAVAVDFRRDGGPVAARRGHLIMAVPPPVVELTRSSRLLSNTI